MRQRLFEVIEVGSDDDRVSQSYDLFMMLTIIISIIPLWTHSEYPFFNIIDRLTVVIFIIDYVLRWITADKKLDKMGVGSFFLYPLTPLAIIDLLSILPSISSLAKGLRLLKVFRLLRTLKIFRVFKAFRYSKSISIIINCFKRQKESLLVVLGFSCAYIIITALIMFQAEPETFPSMLDSIYWSVVSLTTVGYGDVIPLTPIGRAVAGLSSLLGVAVVALPAAILMSSYQEEVNNSKKGDRGENNNRMEGNDLTD